MINITDDDIWSAEPALRPEDEIVLRKLHDVLQSTADDLKLLSGELTKYHEPGVQVKSLPTPLDEDFNEKVHIEELVNAKFHGYNVVHKSQPTPTNAQREKVDRLIKSIPSDIHKSKKVLDSGIKSNQVPILQKPARRNALSVARTKIIQFNENISNSGNVENSGPQKEKTSKPTVAYKELSFQYAEPNIKVTPPKTLQVQNMPSINIRGELREQKVLQLNIEPVAKNDDQQDLFKSNVAVISVLHEPISVPKTVPIITPNRVQQPIFPTATCSKEPIRKFSKMSSFESSDAESYNRVHFVSRSVRNIRPYKTSKTGIKIPSKQNSEIIKNKRNVSCKKESTKHSNSNLDLWKKKLNAVYGCPTSSRKSNLVYSENKTKKPVTKSISPICNQPIENQNTLNNAEYIPYSKLTLGGARVSDIEKELSGIPNTNDLTLGPILNKILSRENSFHHVSPRVATGIESPKILTTSDENLLREVLDIEKKVTTTLTKNFDGHSASFNKEQSLNDVDDQDSYVDDFEDEKSDNSVHNAERNQLSDNSHSDEMNLGQSHDTDSDNKSLNSDSRKENIQNKTYSKTMNLSFKKNVDVFEFVHNIDTQDTGTQINTTEKISLKETQTTPRNEKCNMQPIHNDLWPSIDPKEEVEKLFQLEKDFIKKLIVDEYGDLIEKNLNKPSTSKGYQSNEEKNVTASQKITQTSPAHVKSVMTSPTRTKTRTTSPVILSVTVDRQTSPIKEELKVNVQGGDDLDLSLDLSSPRFSLRLPQTSREVITNLESHAQSNQNASKSYLRKARLAGKNTLSSSSSADGDYYSSDISSMGEIRFKLKKFRKLQVSTLSELSSTSHSQYSSDVSDVVIPLRSEGEISLGQAKRRNHNKNTKSEGEASVGRLY